MFEALTPNGGKKKKKLVDKVRSNRKKQDKPNQELLFKQHQMDF